MHFYTKYDIKNPKSDTSLVLIEFTTQNAYVSGHLVKVAGVSCVSCVSSGHLSYKELVPVHKCKENTIMSYCMWYHDICSCIISIVL